MLFYLKAVIYSIICRDKGLASYEGFTRDQSFLVDRTFECRVETLCEEDLPTSAHYIGCMKWSRKRRFYQQLNVISAILSVTYPFSYISFQFDCYDSVWITETLAGDPFF